MLSLWDGSVSEVIFGKGSKGVVYELNPDCRETMKLHLPKPKGDEAMAIYKPLEPIYKAAFKEAEGKPFDHGKGRPSTVICNVASAVTAGTAHGAAQTRVPPETVVNPQDTNSRRSPVTEARDETTFRSSPARLASDSESSPAALAGKRPSLGTTRNGQQEPGRSCRPRRVGLCSRSCGGRPCRGWCFQPT